MYWRGPLTGSRGHIGGQGDVGEGEGEFTGLSIQRDAVQVFT